MSNEIDIVSNETIVQNTNPKKNTGIILGAVIAVLLILGLGGFYFYFSSPKTIITNLVAKVFDGAKEMVDQKSDFDIEKDTLSVDGNLKIDTSIKGLETLKEEQIGFNFGVDYKNEKLEAGVSLSEKKKELLNAMVYFINNKLYLDLNDAYDKIIEVDSQEFDFSDMFNIDDLKDVEFSNEDIQDLIEEMKDVVIKSIEMDKFEKSSEKIKIDGKDVSVTKLSYNLNEKNTQKLMENIIDNCIANKDLLKLLSKISNEEVDDIKSSLEDAKDDLDDIEKIGKLNIYTKGLTNEFVRLELKAEDGAFTITSTKEGTELAIKAEDVLVKALIKEYTEEKFNIEFSVKEDENKISGSILSTLKETKKDKYTGSIEFKLNYAKEKFNAKLNYNIELNKKIASVDTKNAVSMKKMSYSETQKINNNLSSKLYSSNIYKILTSFTMTSLNSYSSYDEDDDDDYSYNSRYDDEDDDNESYDDDFDFDLED